jgi:hypothetical protein
MTELDAHLVAVSDATEALDRIERAGGAPAQVDEILWSFILHRVKGLGGGVALNAARQISHTEVRAQTFSQRFAHQVRGLLNGVSSLLEEEDLQALMIWLLGSRDLGPGYVQQVFETIQDSTVTQELLALENLVSQLRGRINSVNSRMSAQIKALPEPQRRMVTGGFDEAGLALDNGDGERCRSQMIAARHLARKLINRHQLSQRMSTTDRPQGRPSLQ